MARYEAEERIEARERQGSNQYAERVPARVQESKGESAAIIAQKAGT